MIIELRIYFLVIICLYLSRNSALEGIDEFKEDPIKDLKVNEMGEGIGQLGQFALLKILRESGNETKIFAKAQTPNEDIDEASRAYPLSGAKVFNPQQEISLEWSN